MAETRRVAIVTGAAGGIGRAITRGLLAAGIRVAGIDRMYMHRLVQKHGSREALASTSDDEPHD